MSDVRPRFLVMIGWVVMVLGLLAIGRGLTRVVNGEILAAALTCAIGGSLYLLGRLLRGSSVSR